MKPQTPLSGLTMNNVSLSRDTNGDSAPILDTVCARFPKGKAGLVTGPVGAGKSTILHLLAALLRPTAGEVLADGKPISRFTGSHRDRWRKTVGVVFQGLELLEDRTVFDNVLLPLHPRPWRFAEKRANVEAAVDTVGLTPHLLSKVSSLSGGERQKTAIARALTISPEYLLADEPTAHLDDENTALITQIFQETTAWGGTVVVVSHDSRVVDSGIFDLRYRLTAGKIETIR